MKNYDWFGKSVSKISLNENLDAALELIGYGRFHFSIIASCAFCFISTGLQYGVTAYAMPAAHCELDLQATEIGFVNASFLVGGVCSSFVWGVMADLSGRRKVLVGTLLLDALVTVCCALTQNFTGLVVCRFFNGVLIGASGSVTFTYLAEFHAPKHRTKSIYYLGVFLTIPYLLLPALAWCILPTSINVNFEGITICSPWRMLLLVVTVPEILGGICLINSPESPKFLAEMGSQSAVKVLEKMYVANSRKDISECPIKYLLENVILKKIPTKTKTVKKRAKNVILRIYVQIYKLFKRPLLPVTLLTSVITFSNMFGYFGMGLWIPVLLNKKSENMTLSFIPNENCSPNFNPALYKDIIIVGAVTLLSNLLAGWLSDKFQKKVIPLVTLLSGGVSAVWIYWADSSFQDLAATCIFQSTMSISNIAIGSVVVELFPTDVNAIAICTTIMAGRIGAIFSNIVFGYLFDLNTEVAIFLVAAILVTGAFLCLFIPNSAVNSRNVSNRNAQEIQVSVI